MEFQELQQKLEKLKSEDPAKYLKFLKDLNQIVQDLNRELAAAKAELTKY